MRETLRGYELFEQGEGKIFIVNIPQHLSLEFQLKVHIFHEVSN